jgi:hypothetical protein
MSVPLLVVFVSFCPSDLYEYDTRRKENLHVQSYNALTTEKRRSTGLSKGLKIIQVCPVFYKIACN